MSAATRGARFALLLAALLSLVAVGPLRLSRVSSPLLAHGLVMDELTAAPVPGARVFVLCGAARFETTADSNGEYLLPLPALGSGREPPEAWEEGYVLRAEAEGYLPDRAGWVEGLPSLDSCPQGPVMLLPVAARVTVKAVDEDGAEVTPARMHLSGAAVPDTGWIPAPAPPIPVTAGILTVRVVTGDRRCGRASEFVLPGSETVGDGVARIVPNR